MNAEKAKQMLRSKREKPALSEEGAVSTGSTLLNLACTNNPSVGFLKGKYYYLVGDSASGKTWLSLTCFAEACLNEAFKTYRFIFDDVEGGALMDIEHYFGKEVVRRMEPPATKKGEPVYSETIESFYYNLESAIEAGRPFIYVLDSQDALDSKASAKKFKEQRKARDEGHDAKGSYGDGKAKTHSERLRHALSELRKLGSILIIIGQTRDNLGFGFEKKTRSGGRSLRFYATLEIWSSIGHKLKKRVRGIPRTVGIDCIAEVKKNRVSGRIGRDRAVTIPIYYGLGIDDIGSCVDYLLVEGHWRKVKKKEDSEQQPSNGKIKKKAVYNAAELMFTGTREQIIHYIEEEGLEKKVRGLVARLWNEIEKECEPDRKRRYA